MKSTAYNELRDLFFRALEFDTPAELTGFLDANCVAQPALRQHIEALLEAHHDSGNFMGGTDDGASGSDHLEHPGSVIDRFRILSALGEGGFGVVYLAEQFEPIVRRVALKVIKPGMDTRQVISRFQAERQALALMDHPNIAHVLDGGQTPSGRPYFVMELVSGAPITEYCDAQRLSIRQRIELFIDVCRAVHHAHQKGLIHCDLKPSNVLVMPCDHRPVIKVIDFGIARLLKPAVGEGTESVGLALLHGSPNYMSPEQWPMSGMDVDTRSDVYSLGVLLYQLLTGKPPFERKGWAAMPWEELFRSVRDEVPLPPSQLITEHDHGSLAAASLRGVDAKRLFGLLRGELDWIVLKALEGDRTRRYDSASALADDLERYWKGEPVQAAPPSRRYRLRKLWRRHRLEVVSVAAILFCMLLATAISLSAAARVRRSEVLANQRLSLQQSAARRANEATNIARAQQQETERQRRRAESNLNQARLMIDHVLSHLPDATVQPEIDIERLRRDVLQDALEFFQEFLQANASDPRLQSDMAKTLLQIGDVHQRLAQWDQAEQSIRHGIAIYANLKQRNPDDPSYGKCLAAAQVKLASILKATQLKLDEAEALYRQGLEAYETLATDQDPSAADLGFLIDELDEFGHFLAFTMGRRIDAEPYLSRAVALGRRLAESNPQPENQIRLARVCNSLGILYRQSRTPEAALALHTESAQLLQQVTEAGFPGDLRGELARSLTHLGMAKIATGDRDGAEMELRRAVELRTALSVEFPKSRDLRIELAINEAQLSGVLQMQHRLDQAENELRTSVLLFEELARSAPNDVTFTHYAVDSGRRLGDLLAMQHDAMGAAKIYESLSSWQIATPAAANAMAWHLANCPLAERRNPARAIELAKQAVDGTPDEGSFWSTLGAAQYRAGDFQAALQSLKKAQQLLADLGDSIPGFLLAMTYFQLGQHDSSEREYSQARTCFRNRPTWVQDDDLIAVEASQLLGHVDFSQ